MLFRKWTRKTELGHTSCYRETHFQSRGKSYVFKEATSPLQSRLIATHLYEIQIDVVELEAIPTRGGAIEPLGDKLLVATPRGRLALIDSAGGVAYLPHRVPMNESASEGPILRTGFRVADILLQKREQNRYTLFVSHHYFTGSCVEFRISSVSLLIDDSDVSVSGEWKTEFTANPCIDNDIFDFGHRGGIQAGGRMLMDGPDHLLLVTGDQAYYEWYQEENPQEAPLRRDRYCFTKAAVGHSTAVLARVTMPGPSVRQ